MTSRVAARWIGRIARTFNLADWGLEGLAEGRPVTLYHGTTKSFRTFDSEKIRTELVTKYYGGGIFLTPEKKVAWQYAEGNRNTGFDPEVLDDMKAANPKAGEIMGLLYTKGDAAWDIMQARFIPLAPNGEGWAVPLEEYLGGNIINEIADVCRYIIGSKLVHEPSDDTLDLLFGNKVGSNPSYLFDTLDELGVDSKKYRPKVYTVQVAAHNPLATANKAQARNAKKNGYDCVVYYGSDLVGGVPEVAVYNPHQVKITHVEVA